VVSGKLQLVMFRCVHGTAPRYLSASVYCVANVPFYHHLRSSSTDALIVRPTQLDIVGDHAFSGKVWNKNPGNVTASLPLTGFRQNIKSVLFRI